MAATRADGVVLSCEIDFCEELGYRGGRAGPTSGLPLRVCVCSSLPLMAIYFSVHIVLIRIMGIYLSLFNTDIVNYRFHGYYCVYDGYVVELIVNIVVVGETCSIRHFATDNRFSSLGQFRFQVFLTRPLLLLTLFSDS